MKIIFAALLLLPSMLFPFCLPADTMITNTVLRGVIHKKIVQDRGPWIINVLQIDLANPDLDIQSAHAFDRFFGRETVPSIAKRKNDSLTHVIAALNADFFDLKTGEVENNQILDATFVKGVVVTGSPHDVFDNVHSQFAFSDDRRPSIDRFRFGGEAVLNNGSQIEIAAVNARPDTDAVTFFNAYFGTTTPVDSFGSGVSEAVLQDISTKGDTTFFLVKAHHSGSGGSTIPLGGAVLSAYGRSRQLQQYPPFPGDTIRVFLGLRPYHGPIRTLVGGWPRIVLNGKSVAHLADSLEGTFPRFSANRHPRSGVGFSKDSTRVYFVTVDGRQKSSVGMSLVEFGDLMVSLGIYQGLNLDGGGSTTLVIHGTVVNSPSDTAGVRPVGNCILLFSRKRQ